METREQLIQKTKDQLNECNGDVLKMYGVLTATMVDILVDVRELLEAIKNK